MGQIEVTTRTDIDVRTADGWADVEQVRAVATGALSQRGVPAAASLIDLLLETSLNGVHTHGIRMLASYLDELDRGVAVADAEPTIVKDSGPVVVLDARSALGIVAGLHGSDLAVQRARAHGVGVVGVRHSNHFGAAGCYTRRMAAAGMMGIASTSAASRVAPFGGADALFGTNPLSIAYGPELCLDMATSQVCFGEIKERMRTGEQLDAGWAVDDSGTPTADPAAASALSPLGGYKGQGLAMMVTMLTAVLVGGPLDFELDHIGSSADGHDRGITHLFLALDPEAMGGKAAADDALGRLVDQVRRSRPAEPSRPVLIPGDPQRQHAARQLRHGLQVDAATAAMLDALVADQ